jgi:hypothetical protein
MRQYFPTALFVPATLAITLCLISPDASAYLDPSTGSMVVTALVGIFASVALALKTWWYKLISLFRRSGRQGMAADKDSPSND